MKAIYSVQTGHLLQVWRIPILQGARSFVRLWFVSKGPGACNSTQSKVHIRVSPAMVNPAMAPPRALASTFWEGVTWYSGPCLASAMLLVPLFTCQHSARATRLGAPRGHAWLTIVD